MPATDARTSRRPSSPCFNEAAGADPADARLFSRQDASERRRFNEAAGADPADALDGVDATVGGADALQ